MISCINEAISEASNAEKIRHPGLVGRIREITIDHLLKPLLPAGFTIGTGKIVNRFDKQSSEVDVVIYNSSILPPVMYSDRDGIFPIESSYYSIEVKSRLTAAEVQKAYKKGKQLISLYKQANQPKKKNAIPTVLVLFAFGTDLIESSSELERYARYDLDWNTDPVLKAICVIGRGYWYHRAGENRWAFHPPTPEHDEVIDIVSGITNTLLKQLPFQRIQPLGYYLSIDREILFKTKEDV